MNVKAYVAEFVGTFALVWVGIYAIHHLSGVPGGLVGIALAQGLAIGILASATMAVSGGHLNPAITLAMLMTRKIKGMDALCYIIVQIAAGFAAAGMVRMVHLYDGPNMISSAQTLLAGTPQVSAILSPDVIDERAAALSGWVLEAIATFYLAFAVLGTMADKRAPKTGGLFVGLAVTMGILAIGPFTGGALNPARWLGPAMLADVATNGTMSLYWQMFVYLVGPVTGAVVAGWVYQFVIVGRDQAASG